VKLAFLKKFFAGGEHQKYKSDACETNRSVLLVTPCTSERNTVQVVSIEERWRLLIAPTLDCAVRILDQEHVGVVLYDRHLPLVDWRLGVRRLLECPHPICLILLSAGAVGQLRPSVLECGGYDAASKPIDRTLLVQLVNGYWALKKSIDSIETKAFP